MSSAIRFSTSFFFSSRRRHTRSLCDWSSDVCSSDLGLAHERQRALGRHGAAARAHRWRRRRRRSQSGMRQRARAGLAFAALVLAPCEAGAAQVLATEIQLARDQVRIVIDGDAAIRFRLLSLRRRLVLELEDTVSGQALDALPAKVPSAHPYLDGIRVTRLRPRGIRLQIDLKAEVEPRISAQGFRLVLELSPTRAVAPALEEMFLEMRLNQQALQTALILRQGDGALFARKDDLQRWRLRLPELTPLAYRGEEYYPLAAFPGLSYRIDEARQALVAEAPASL